MNRLDPRSDVLVVQKQDIRVAVVAAVTGALTGAGVSELVHQVTAWQWWLFTGTSALAFLTCVVTLGFVRSVTSIVRSTHDAMRDVAGDITSAVTHQAHLIPRDAIYPEMAESIRNAQFEVAVITHFMYDWDAGTRTFLRPGHEPPGRDEFYEAVYECIENPRIQYIRVWEVPQERLAEAEEVICQEDVLRKERDLIKKVEADRPDLARFVIAEQHTTASFILVDRRTFFMNIDFYDPQENVWYSPYMLLVKDAGGEAFADLQSVVIRLTSR